MQKRSPTDEIAGPFGTSSSPKDRFDLGYTSSRQDPGVEPGFGPGVEPYNPEAPGPYDIEGSVCPECGSAEEPLNFGSTQSCPDCGSRRSGGSEGEFGSKEDLGYGDVDDSDFGSNFVDTIDDEML